MSEFVLARQAIFDSKMRTVGYEINIGHISATDDQSAQLDLDSFLTFLIEKSLIDSCSSSSFWNPTICWKA